MLAHNRFLTDWFNRVRTGQLRLPRFQRFEAWNQEKVRGLLKTVLRGLPAGATLILEVGDKELFRSRTVVGAPSPVERVTEHLLDGQQRITALWRSLTDQYEDRTFFISFESGDDDEDESQSGPFVISQPRWERDGRRYPVWADDPEQIHKKGYIPVGLLCPGEMGNEISKWCKSAVDGDFDAFSELTKTINQLRERVATFNVPYLALPTGTSKGTAIRVFIEMNTSSVQLTAFDIVVAEVEEATGESLHDLVAGVKAEAPSVDSYVDPSDLILSIAAMREDRPPTIASFEKLNLERLVTEWGRIEKGIAFSLQLLEDEKVLDAERLPTTVVLPVLGALYDSMPSALDALGNARTLLRKYLWRSFVTRRYENNAATRSLQDLRGLRAVIVEGKPESIAPIFDESQFPLPSVEELRRAGWPKKKEILARGILAVSVKGGAVDIADGAQVSRSHLQKREYHHLFPDALFSEAPESDEGISFRALNCILVTWNTNRHIAAKEPLQYLRERVQRAALGEQEIRARLSTHTVPFDALNVGGYADISDKSERYERIRSDYFQFLDARAKALIDAIAKLSQGHNWNGAS